MIIDIIVINWDVGKIITYNISRYLLNAHIHFTF